MLWHKAPRESDQLTLLRAETSSIWAALSADTASHRGSHAAGPAPRGLSVRLPSSLSCAPVSAAICLPWLYLFPTVGNEINVLRIPGLWGINRISSAFLQKGCQEKLHSTREEIRGIVSGESESESRSVASDSLRPHGLSPWNSPGQNIGVGSLSLLQGIFPTEGSNPGLPHCRQILYQLSPKGSPGILEWVAYPFFSRFS